MMSYDLIAIKARTDEEACELCRMDLAASPELSEEDARWQEEVAACLIEAEPSLDRFTFDYAEIANMKGITEDEARRGHSQIELDAMGARGHLNFQFLISPQRVFSSVAYQPASGAAQLLRALELHSIVCERFGLRLFDPQIGRVADPRNERDVVMEVYEKALRQSGDGARSGVEASAKACGRPWWKFW